MKPCRSFTTRRQHGFQWPASSHLPLPRGLCRPAYAPAVERAAEVALLGRVAQVALLVRVAPMALLERAAHPEQATRTAP